jgi:Cu(I)/Ag(I) efflux system membrane protein CusA/SilA
MISKIIEYSVRNRALILIATVALLLGGIYAARHIALDAIPDLSDVQVIIFTQYEGQGPQVVEDQITYPLTTAMLSVPFAKVVRGYSFFDLSFVYIIFEDGTDLYWARSRVLEYLNFVSGRLPPGVTPTLGPDATGVGWVYEYALVDKTGRHDLAQLRSIQDWFLRYELIAVPGVAEVASVGGYVKQYQVEVDPDRLLAFGIPLGRVKEAIQRSNNDVGGRLVERAETEFMVRGLGYIKSLKDLEEIPLGVDARGTPILLSQVANIHLGPELRRGLVELDGEGEVAGGVIVMRFGENALEVINGVKAKLESLQTGLPEGVEIVPVYDRSSLILRAIDNLKTKLMEEMAVVAIVIVLFLLHIPSTLVAAIVLPLGVLASLLLMHLLGINANIMSMGGIAIAIGVMVDASVVLVENAHKHLERWRAAGGGASPPATGRRPGGGDEEQAIPSVPPPPPQPSPGGGSLSRADVIIAASKEVGPALFYSLLIITVSFFPVFALTEQSGRLFRPLAFTKTFAMGASAVLAITVIPVLMYYVIRGRVPDGDKNPINRATQWAYHPFIRVVLRFPWLTIVVAVVILAATLYPARRLGSEFMPPLYEGDLLYMPTTLPGISVTKARELLQQTDKIIATFPEVERVFGKIGRAESATDPAPLDMVETTIWLKSEGEWRHVPVARFFRDWPEPWRGWLAYLWPLERTITPDELAAEMNDAIQFPGLTNAWTMPIKTRIDMLATGIKTPVGIKVMGPDLEVLSEIGQEIEAVVRDIPGTLSVYSERVTGGNYLDFDIDRERAARYGLTVGDVQDVIQSAIGGMNITETVEGLERYPVNLRYSRELRTSDADLERILIATPLGAQIPLGQVAKIYTRKGPMSIKSENARRTAWIFVDLKGIDVGSYVAHAQEVVAQAVKLPAGYSLVWSGQYEYIQQAKERLAIVIPVTLALIFLLLYLHFGNLTDTLIVMATLPFALVGGVWLLYLLGYNLSVAVDVGFIALAGLAAETGVVMLVYLDSAFRDHRSRGEMRGVADLKAAITEGAVGRLRPKLMTVTTTLIGLLPVMVGTEAGSDVMKRIAAPMVGGLISSTLLTLIIIPAVYLLVRRFQLRHQWRVAAEDK